MSLNRNSTTENGLTLSTQPRAVLPKKVAIESEVLSKDNKAGVGTSEEESETNYEDDNDFEPFETSTKDFNKKSNTASSKSGPENQKNPSILQRGNHP